MNSVSLKQHIAPLKGATCVRRVRCPARQLTAPPRAQLDDRAEREKLWEMQLSAMWKYASSKGRLPSFSDTCESLASMSFGSVDVGVDCPLLAANLEADRAVLAAAYAAESAVAPPEAAPAQGPIQYAATQVAQKAWGIFNPQWQFRVEQLAPFRGGYQ